MRQHILTHRAARHLLEIMGRVTNDSAEAGTPVLDKLEAAFDFLGANPGAGHYREELLDQRHKFWSVYSYLIVYRWQDHPIQILAIVHGSRDLPRYFEQEGLT